MSVNRKCMKRRLSLYDVGIGPKKKKSRVVDLHPTA